MNNIKDKLEKEKIALVDLKAKRDKIEEKIKLKNESIEKLELMLNQQKFNEANHVFENNGLTLNDILEAVNSGDFSSLQNIVEDNKTGR